MLQKIFDPWCPWSWLSELVAPVLNLIHTPQHLQYRDSVHQSCVDGRREKEVRKLSHMHVALVAFLWISQVAQFYLYVAVKPRYGYPVERLGCKT